MPPPRNSCSSYLPIRAGSSMGTEVHLISAFPATRAARAPGDVSCGLAPQNPLPPVASGGALRHLPLLLVLFAGSGCSALIYEIVWYQLIIMTAYASTDSAVRALKFGAFDY